MARAKRRIKLIKPALQLKMVGVFLGVGIACVVIQFTLLNIAMSDLASAYPQHAVALSNASYEILWHHLFLTLGLMVPLTVFIGILVTFRISGPVYRFEQYMKSIANGEDPGRCYIRKGDEFHELCDYINAAVEELKTNGPPRTLDDEFEAEEATKDTVAEDTSDDSDVETDSETERELEETV